MGAKTAVIAMFMFVTLDLVGPARADAVADGAAGDAAKNRGQFDQAIQLYTRAINTSGGLDPITRCAFYNNRGWALILRGNAGGGSKDFEQSLADFSEAIRLSPQQWQPFHNRGTAYRALGQNDRATVDRNQAIRMNAEGVRQFEALNPLQQKTHVGEATYPTPPPQQPAPSVNQGTYKYEQPDYMKRAEEARKRQNAANCERASKGANVYCSR